MPRRVAHLAVRLGKRRPFASPQQEAYLNLVRTHAALTAPFDHLMKAHGISQPLYNILRILRGHLSNDRARRDTHLGVPVLRIRDEMVTREPDMTRLTARLEQAGLVTRTRCAEDRRVVYVRITDAGLSLLDTLDPEVDALHREQFAALSRDEMTLLSRLLYRSVRGEGGETTGRTAPPASVGLSPRTH